MEQSISNIMENYWLDEVASECESEISQKAHRDPDIHEAFPVTVDGVIDIVLDIMSDEKNKMCETKNIKTFKGEL